MAKVTLSNVRFSYTRFFVAGEDGRYSTTILIPKSDTATYEKLLDAYDQAREAARNKGVKNPERLRTNIHDGDGPAPEGGEYGPECRGHWVFTASTYQQPKIVDRYKQSITDPREFKSGDYGRAVLNTYFYDKNGKKGITTGLNGVMKTRDGEPLGFGVSESDWGEVEEETDEIPF